MADRRWWLPFALGLLAACGTPPDLPPPGAHGAVQAWQWQDGDGALVSELQAAGITAEAGVMDRFQADRVRLRRFMPDGFLVLKAAQAELALSDEPLVRVPGPITISGWMAGQPMQGQAERVDLRQDQRVVLFRVRASHAGRAIWAEQMLLGEAGLDGSGWQIDPEHPGLVAVQAALPRLDRSR